MSSKPPKKNLEFKNLFAPRSPLEFLGFALISNLISLISAGNPLGFISIGAIAILWWWIDRQRTKRLSPEVMVSLTKEPPYGAKGLILLLSPYSPRDAVLKDPQKLTPLIEQILKYSSIELKPENFEAIDLFNSNLMPQIKAVEYHVQQGKLQEVWLITSKSYETVKGSELTANILQQYLHFLYGQQLDIHWGEEFSVIDWDYKGLWQLAENIFRNSDYKDEVLVADVTGGTKMMSVALAMACVPPRRRMQYMDSQRDWQGNHLSIGEIKPVLIDVDPMLHSSQN